MMRARVISWCCLAACTPSPTSPAPRTAAPVDPVAPPTVVETRTPASEPETPAPPPPPPAARTLPSTPRPFLFYRKVDDHWAHTFFVAGGGAAPRKLPFVVDHLHAGTLWIGSSGPVLSADGAWLAFTGRKRALVVAALDGKARHEIPAADKRGQVDILIAGFSPDGKALLFHLGEIPAMDEQVPLPKGVVPGFHLLRLPDMTVERIEGIDNFVSWMEDGRHVLSTDERETRLTMIGWSPADRVDLRTGTDALSQPDFNGVRMTFVRDVRRGWVQVVASRLDGVDLVPVTNEREFAFVQFPKLSPDNERVAYCEGRRVGANVGFTMAFTLHVVALDDLEHPTKLGDADGCRYAWERSDALLALQGDDLARLQLDGTREVAAPDVDGFVMAGDPG